LRPAQYETRRNLAISYNKLSAVYRAAGDRSSSVGFLEKLLRFRQEVAAARPHLAMSARELAHAFEAVGSSEADLGQWDAAEPSYHRASGILELISWDKTSRHEYDWETFEFDSADYQNLAEAHLRCSTLAFHKGDAVLAERYTRSGLSVYEWLAGAFASVDVHDGCARALLTCEPANLRDPKKALEYALRVEKATQSSPSPQFLNTLAMAYFATGQTGEAAREQQKAISLLRFGNPAHSKGGLLDQFETRLAAYRKAAGQ